MTAWLVTLAVLVFVYFLQRAAYRCGEFGLMIRRIAVNAYEFAGLAFLMAARLAWFVVLP